MQKLTGTSEGKLSGKVAVITGGTEGIGFATAQLFVNEGAHVFITGRRQKELDEAVKAIGRSVTGVQGDVTNLADLDRLYEVVAKSEGQIDIILANAGYGEFAPFGKITEDHFDKLFNVNVKGSIVHGAKGSAVVEGWWLHNHHRFRGGLKGHSRLWCLRGNKAAVPLACANVGLRI